MRWGGFLWKVIFEFAATLPAKKHRPVDRRLGEPRKTAQENSGVAEPYIAWNWRGGGRGNLHRDWDGDRGPALRCEVDPERTAARIPYPPFRLIRASGRGAGDHSFVCAGRDRMRIRGALLRGACSDDSHRRQCVHLHVRDDG